MKVKRTSKKRGAAKKDLVRGEPVVRIVLAAALEELAVAGYRALRIEDVAARAGVNKTTIYRRWPAKADLVRAALKEVGEEKLVTPNTGSLRGDMLALARGFLGLFTSLSGKGLFRVMVAEGPDSEFAAITKSLRDSEVAPRVVIESAVARGEIAPDVDPELLGEALVSFIIHRFFVHQEMVDEARLTRLVDALLFGVLPRGPEPGPAREGGAARVKKKASGARSSD